MYIRNWTVDQLCAYLKKHGCELVSDEYFDEGRLLFKKDHLIIPVQAHKGRPFFPAHIVQLCSGIGIPCPPEMLKVHKQLEEFMNRPKVEVPLRKDSKEEEK